MTKQIRTPYSCPNCGSNQTRYRVTRKAHICNRCGKEFTLGEPTEIVSDSLFGETKETREATVVSSQELDAELNKDAQEKVTRNKDGMESLGFVEGQAKP